MPSNLNHALADAFYLICEEEESTDTVEEIRNNALEKIQGGELKTIVNSSLNGKSAGYQVSAPATEIFAAASYAIRKYNRGLIQSTEADFSSI